MLGLLTLTYFTFDSLTKRALTSSFEMFRKQIVHLPFILTRPAKTFDLPPPRDHKHVQEQRGFELSPRGAPLQAHPVKSCYPSPP